MRVYRILALRVCEGLRRVLDSNIFVIEYSRRIATLCTLKFQFLLPRQNFSKSSVESTQIFTLAPKLIDFGCVPVEGELSPQIDPILIPIPTDRSFRIQWQSLAAYKIVLLWVESKVGSTH